jgi:hypothetical protein
MHAETHEKLDWNQHIFNRFHLIQKTSSWEIGSAELGDRLRAHFVTNKFSFSSADPTIRKLRIDSSRKTTVTVTSFRQVRVRIRISGSGKGQDKYIYLELWFWTFELTMSVLGIVHNWRHAILHIIWPLPPIVALFITEALVLLSQNPRTPSH